MKRQFAFLSFCIMAVGITTSAGPVMTVAEDKFDFGYVPQHAHVSHRFMLHSTGDTAVSITRVVPGCACTKLPLEKDVIQPGDSGYIEIVFNSFTYMGPTDRTPKFYTNDTTTGAEREHIITFHSVVTQRPDSTYPVIIYPYKLDLTPVGGATRDKIKFTITNVTDKDLNLTMIYAPKEIGDVVLPATVKAKSDASGTVTLRKDALTQEFEKSFTFVVNDSASTRFTVPIKRFLSTESAEKAAQETNH